MDTIYITDGTLEGMLTAVYEMYYSGDIAMDILRQPPLQPNFTVPYKEIVTDSNKAVKVYDAITAKISERAAEEATYTWLSELPYCGKHVADYLRLGFKTGYRVDFLLSNKFVLPVHKAAAKVRMEVHRLSGICRFSKTDKDFYFCEITPDHNVVSLLASHFSARMNDVNWIIHDKSRKICAVYNKENWFIAPSEFTQSIAYSKEEYMYRRIWKEYFDIIAIEGRINPKLQRKFIPMRYRKNITEFQGVTTA